MPSGFQVIPMTLILNGTWFDSRYSSSNCQSDSAYESSPSSSKPISTSSTSSTIVQPSTASSENVVSVVNVVQRQESTRQTKATKVERKVSFSGKATLKIFVINRLYGNFDCSKWHFWSLKTAANYSSTKLGRFRLSKKIYNSNGLTFFLKNNFLNQPFSNHNLNNQTFIKSVCDQIFDEDPQL